MQKIHHVHQPLPTLKIQNSKSHFLLPTSNFIMSSIFHLPLTTAEAHDLKSFIRLHTKYAGKIDLTDAERCLAFIADRIPDVLPGQQTFTTESKDTPAPQKPENFSTEDLFSLCYDIILTASPSNIKKGIQSFASEYSIIDPSTQNTILRAIRFRPIFSKRPEYGIYLYDSILHMPPLLAIEVYNTLFIACEKIIAEKEREKEKSEQEKRSERLAASIKKAHQYISSNK